VPEVRAIFAVFIFLTEFLSRTELPHLSRSRPNLMPFR